MDVLAARRTETNSDGDVTCFCRVPVTCFCRFCEAALCWDGQKRAPVAGACAGWWRISARILSREVYFWNRFFSFAYKSWRSLEDANLVFVPIYSHLTWKKPTGDASLGCLHTRWRRNLRPLTMCPLHGCTGEAWKNLIRLTLAEVILRQVIEEARVILSDFRDFQDFFLWDQVETLCPDSLSLVPARKRLQEFQVGRRVEWIAKPLTNELNPGGNQAANQPHPGLDHSALIDPEEERRITLYTRLNYLEHS